MSEKNNEDLPTLYDDLGGEQVVKELVDKFYDIMHDNPEFEVIRKMHPDNLKGSREKLYMFFSGWMGGPPLYINRFGHPRLRARHMPFPISETERDQWIKCMHLALEQMDFDKKLKEELLLSLYKVADFMRNRAESTKLND